MARLWTCLIRWLKGEEPAEKETPAMPTDAERRESNELRQTIDHLSENLIDAVGTAKKRADLLDAQIQFYRATTRSRPHEMDDDGGVGPRGAGDDHGPV